jgi:hypothetical protein
MNDTKTMMGGGVCYSDLDEKVDIDRDDLDYLSFNISSGSCHLRGEEKLVTGNTSQRVTFSN